MQNKANFGMGLISWGGYHRPRSARMQATLDKVRSATWSAVDVFVRDGVWDDIREQLVTDVDYPVKRHEFFKE